MILTYSQKYGIFYFMKTSTADRTRMGPSYRRRCSRCNSAMRLFGTETHPIIDAAELRTFICVKCDAVETEAVQIEPDLPAL
jgi:hypothetical protein